MGRKPERYKKELVKTETKLKEASNLGTEEGDEGGKRDVIDRISDEAVYKAWREKHTPEHQKPTVVPDEITQQANKDLQSILDIEYPGLKVDYFDDADYYEDKFSIAVSSDVPEFFQVAFCYGGNRGIFNIGWKTIKEPKIVTTLRKIVKDFQKGGDDKQIAILFRRFSKIHEKLIKEHIATSLRRLEQSSK